MNKIYWWPLAKNLVDTIKKHKDQLGTFLFKDIEVYGGSKLNGKKYPCIEVTYDRESNVKIHRPIQGNVTLWVDINIKNNNANPSEAYEIMYHWQTEIIDCLTNWQNEIRTELGIAAKVEVEDIISDGDVQRPVCACRLAIYIEWRNTI